MKCYCPLHAHSFYSLLDGLCSPDQLVKRAKEVGSPAMALSDHGSLFGIVEFQKACKKYNIKPIIGCEIYMSELDPSIRTNENRSHNHLTILAKNQDGVKDLISLVSTTNRPDWFYRKPRIDLNNLAAFAKRKNLICLSGCIAGKLSSSLFEDVGKACLIGEQTEDINEVKKILKPDWRNIADKIIAQYQEVFGKENYFIELQEEGMPAQKVVVECLREAAKSLDIKTVATLDAHYAKKDQAEDHRILLYSQLHTTAEEQTRIKQQGGDTMSFFFRDTFYIFSPEEMSSHYTDEEIENTLLIADMIKPYSVGRNPCLPKFTKQDKQNSDEYLKDLCIQSAKIKLTNLDKNKKKIYWERLQKELRVIKEAKLADYLLIVYDACKFVDDNNGPRGVGRGSGAGSLVNYLLNITKIDPLEYGLYFERFYNASRMILPHFDVGPTTFMQWLSDNSDSITQEKIDDARNIVRNLIIQYNLKYKTITNKKLLKEEADWIDKNNPKMWLYILEIFKNNQTMCLSSEDQVLGLEFPNPNNSHIIFSLRMHCKLYSDKSVQTNPGHISLPDIDTDIGVDFREKVIEYIKQKWGEDKVAQMITFGRLQGKAALKEVFRAQPDLVKHLTKVKYIKLGKKVEEINMTPHEICNEITSYIPDEAQIMDELQQIRDETENQEYGIIDWSVEHIDQVKESYQWYKPLFDQAIRIEGTKKSQSKHAAGVVISDLPIKELVPMAYDAKSKNVVVGVEMNNAEQMGAVKFDFLGVVALDKLRFAQDLINESNPKANVVEDFIENE